MRILIFKMALLQLNSRRPLKLSRPQVLLPPESAEAATQAEEAATTLVVVEVVVEAESVTEVSQRPTSLCNCRFVIM